MQCYFDISDDRGIVNFTTKVLQTCMSTYSQKKKRKKKKRLVCQLLNTEHNKRKLFIIILFMWY